MNTIQLLGRVGKTPEIRYAQSGIPICNLSLATSEKIKGEEKTQWHRLVAFSKTAELIEKYVKKGDQLCIEGKIQYDKYDKNGNTVYTTDIIVNRIHFIGGKSNNGQTNNNRQNQGSGQNHRQFQGGSQGSQDDDSAIPF